MYMKYTINIEDRDVHTIIENMLKERVYQHVTQHHPGLLQQIKKELQETLLNAELDNK